MWAWVGAAIVTASKLTLKSAAGDCDIENRGDGALHSACTFSSTSSGGGGCSALEAKVDVLQGELREVRTALDTLLRHYGYMPPPTTPPTPPPPPPSPSWPLSLDASASSVTRNGRWGHWLLPVGAWMNSHDGDPGTNYVLPTPFGSAITLKGTATGWLGKFPCWIAQPGTYSLRFGFVSDGSSGFRVDNDGVHNNEFNQELVATTTLQRFQKAAVITTTGDAYFYLRRDSGSDDIRITAVELVLQSLTTAFATTHDGVLDSTHKLPSVAALTLIGTATGWIGSFPATVSTAGSYLLTFAYASDGSSPFVVDNDGVHNNEFNAEMTATTMRQAYARTAAISMTGDASFYFRRVSGSDVIYITDVSFTFISLTTAFSTTHDGVLDSTHKLPADHDNALTLIGTATGWIGSFPATVPTTGKHTLTFDYVSDGSSGFRVDNDGQHNNEFNAEFTATTTLQHYAKTVDVTTTGDILFYFKRDSGTDEIQVSNVRFVRETPLGY